MRAALGHPPGVSQVYVTGAAAIQHDLDPVFNRDLKHGELLIAVPIALLVLLFVFGLSWAVTIPLVFAACTISGTLGIVYGVASVWATPTYATNLVQLIGLGIAVDYSLLIVYRFREELALGKSKDDAIVRTMETAGRAVVFSGIAVALGLALLVAMPLPFIRMLGVAGFLIPIVSILGAVTLQPVLLSYYGRRGTVRRADHVGRAGRPRARVLGRARADDHATAGRVSPGGDGGARRDGDPGVLDPAHAGLDLRDPADLGVRARLRPLAEGGRRRRGRAGPDPRRGEDRLRARPCCEGGSRPARRLAREGSRGREGLRRSSARASSTRANRFRQVLVAGRHDYGFPQEQALVKRIRSDLIPAAGFPETTQVLVGGGPGQGVDFLHQAYTYFVPLILAVLVLTYFLLMRAFRSLLLPLKAVLLNLLSVAAAYGMLVVFFRFGLGQTLFGLYQFSQVEGWIPIFLFAMLFGLSMDYEVFLVTRMREAWDEGADNETAVAYGLERTGRIITAAAIIMCAAFSGFVAGSIVGLQEFGLGLAVAIFVDATIVRCILVPSMMAILGRWNWWLPAWAARIVRVEPSPLDDRSGHRLPAAGRLGEAQPL